MVTGFEIDNVTILICRISLVLESRGLMTEGPIVDRVPVPSPPR
jgi:hypothetical protein